MVLCNRSVLLVCSTSCYLLPLFLRLQHITPIPGESLKAFNRRVDREFLKVRVAERVAAGPLKQASEKRKEFLEEKKKKKKKNASGSDDDDEDNAQASSDKAAAPAGGSQVIGSLRAGAAIADEKALANQVGALVDTFGHHIDHFDSSLHLQTGKKRSKDTWEEDFPRPEKISFLDRAEAPPQIKSIPKYSRSKKAAVAAATGVLPDNTGRAESDAARRRRELKEKEDAEVARKEMVEEARRQKAKEDAIAAYTLMKQKRMEANRAAAVAAAGTAVGRGVVGALRLGGNL